MSADHLIGNIIVYILNPLIVFVFAIALLVFFIGILQFIREAGEGKVSDDGKKKIVYGLVGMFVMFSAYGFVHLVRVSFALPAPQHNILNI